MYIPKDSSSARVSYRLIPGAHFFFQYFSISTLQKKKTDIIIIFFIQLLHTPAHLRIFEMSRETRVQRWHLYVYVTFQRRRGRGGKRRVFQVSCFVFWCCECGESNTVIGRQLVDGEVLRSATQKETEHRGSIGSIEKEEKQSRERDSLLGPLLVSFSFSFSCFLTPQLAPWSGQGEGGGWKGTRRGRERGERESR